MAKHSIAYSIRAAPGLKRATAYVTAYATVCYTKATGAKRRTTSSAHAAAMGTAAAAAAYAAAHAAASTVAAAEGAPHSTA